MKTYFQRMGRSLMLPVATLPAAALLVGVGHWLPANWAAAQFLQSGGNAILTHLALLFAVGLGLGMAQDKDGSAALAGVVAFIVPTYVLAPAQVATLLGTTAGKVDPAFAAIPANVFIGISAGLVAATMYNRFHNVKLPMAISFFSGKRLVPIMAALVMLLLSLALLFIWPPIYQTLVAFGKFIVGLGAVGAGLYGFFNRLLIPTGLHQALNSVFWFNVAGINDIGNFWASKGVRGTTGMYMAGFFPVMMFGLPAGAFAIYRNALPERKKETASLMLAAGFASFFTGVTEPLEFSFMFVAWPLYVIHAVFTGLSLAFAAWMHWTAGFTFSGGLVDFILSLKVPIANQPLMLIVQGLVMAVIYYFGFDFAIKKFNLMTPGRELVVADDATTITVTAADDKYSLTAKKIYAAIGGAANIKVIDNCTTRLRLQLNDTSKIDQNALKASGAAGINILDKTNLQVIIGTEVQFVADALTQLQQVGTPVTLPARSDAPIPAVPAASLTAGVTETLYSVTAGRFMPIENVSDPTFAQKMLGDGFAIEPESGTIVAPVDAKVVSIFPTKHALGFKTATGLEILLHMGIDTVQLNGVPFDVTVTMDQEVHHGDVVAHVDLAAIKAAGKATTMMVILTNMDHVGYLKIAPLTEKVQLNAPLAQVTTK
ncbi:N-acetylglucosamine-specific PTS transporter subunit IIBC [Loigolactobacillus binensis]|uniref:N-acetylglucosamine-specific PTS transporter subunit IIBC n=1 Tax=Loigolactobacillus binensis TaxID=2559922 RepID=A0ABW3EAJ8_9LACO|nr:N-acetylglucosamine-specific PTS transporter subunit IIBC [Loigolactobacillus binensis]